MQLRHLPLLGTIEWYDVRSMKSDTNSRKAPLSRPMQLRIVGSLAAVLLIIGAFVGTSIGINRMNADIGRIRSEVSGTRDILDSFSELKNEEQRAAPYQELINTKLPSGTDLLAVAASLEERAQFFHLTQMFTFGTEVQTQGSEPRSLGFSQTVNGSLADLVQYLRALESFRVPLDVSHLDGTASGGSLQANITGRIFLP